MTLLQKFLVSVKEDSGVRIGGSILESSSHSRYLKQLMALPFLPHEHITSTFDLLESRLPTGPIKDLTTYMRETWISWFWSPSEWTVFGQSIRTNNDVEGYHRRLNGSAGFSHIPFYVLVPLLFKETKNVQVQINTGDNSSSTRDSLPMYRL
ncbi:uncharacterized protein [Palaemon carinicauda]|uniref:uncharacterized protein n=1 Tax=Palaemon carinicauda TaxID=392227 RepID=UPI0035B68FA6